MIEYLKSMLVLWRMPAELKKRAEEDLKSELDALPPNLRDKANHSRGKKKWKIAFAAKVKSVLANEKREQCEEERDRLIKSGADAEEILNATLRATQSMVDAQASDMIFRTEWTTFRQFLISHM